MTKPKDIDEILSEYAQAQSNAVFQAKTWSDTQRLTRERRTKFKQALKDLIERTFKDDFDFIEASTGESPREKLERMFT